MSLTAIGLLSALSIAWSAKALWSPLVDRYGGRRDWIGGALLAMAAALVAMSGGTPETLGVVLWFAIAVYCIGSATQDIAIDAYTIGLVERGEEGPVNAVRMIFYRVGLIAAGGGMLFLPAWVGWEGAFVAGAVASVLMALSLRALSEVRVPGEARGDTLAALRRWLDRPHVWHAAAFILLYRVGDRAMGPMVRPFWVDLGYSNEEIGLVANTIGQIATAVGAVAGGACVVRLGVPRSLWLLGALALASNLGYAAAAAFPETGWRGLYAASAVESFSSGLAGVGFMSYLMRLCEKERAAVQYAVLTGVYALAGTMVAVPSGWLTEQMGYASYFALTAGFALPAFLFLPRAARLAD